MIQVGTKAPDFQFKTMTEIPFLFLAYGQKSDRFLLS